MELTVEMMKKLLDSAIINNEDVEKDMYVIFRENMLFQVDLKGHKSVAVHRRSA